MDNLLRRPSGIYVARLTIPARLRPILGSREFVASTGSSSRTMAKVVASELLAEWRRKLWEIERLQLPAALMNYDSILKLVDGSPVLRSESYLPIEQAAAAMGLEVADLLRQAADGHLHLYCRLLGKLGYTTKFSDFEPDDPEYGTVLVPTQENRPPGSMVLQATGMYRIPRDETDAVAGRLLAGKPADVVALEVIGAESEHLAFVPEGALSVDVGQIELACVELEARRKHMAQAISPPALAAAREAHSSVAKNALDKTARRGRAKLSAVLGEFCKFRLPQVLTSVKEIERMRSGIALLIEFEGDVSIGDVDADRLRHFRDVHLARMPANENRVRSKYKTKSMSESVQAIAGTDWPLMSAGERDARMKWIARLFQWAYEQKWIADDPCTGLRKESVLTKAERTRLQSEQTPRKEFTDEELTKIFGAPWFLTGRGELTLVSTYRTFQPFYYWLPLLGLCTGARIQELTQLHLTDIVQDGGVWYIDINRKTPDKSLKNPLTARKVPLHSRLIELGFADWCNALRSAGFRRLFPELSWNNKNGYAKDPIRVMSKYFGSLGMPRDNKRVFHSFRHGLNNALHKRTDMPDWMRKRLLGHEAGSGVNEQHYLSDAPPTDVSPYLESLEIPLSHVAPFDIDQGIAAIRDALRRKRSGHGRVESLGPTDD